MPAVRPYWKGYPGSPRFLPSASRPLSSSERVAFRQINKKTGNRLRQQFIEEETREAVEATKGARLRIREEFVPHDRGPRARSD